MNKLFSNIKIKDLELKNRIVMAPMCMVASDDEGYANNWHEIHYASRAIGGTGLIIMEATAVESRGRIKNGDLGIWDDSHIEGLSKIVLSSKALGAKVGIQLAHAGRKCEVKSEDIIAPSPIAFDDSYATPEEMTIDDIKTVTNSFKEGARRANEAGFDTIEIHGAHGYLINEFLSPLTNKRTDYYGGSLENRARFLKEIIKEIKTVWPENKPIILRVSAEEYVEDGNHPEDLVDIINIVKDEGIDIIDVSSGGVVPARIDLYPGYQITFAEIIKKGTSLPVIAGGLVTEPDMAEEILKNNRADFIFLGRELLRNPYWPLEAAHKLNQDIEWPSSYRRAKF
ncbi:NADPH dehydrogenase NamA [Clostridium sp. Cult2]|uniref:NADPH dehydrogenase NamA n=1 Tax=Clostridium sp. Cult2 TaxID=2079003 RepID=UPI001EFFF8E4|nr:NADPH dehydrogenase NamA [Clostridium sp. Cult2]MCF6465938.1 NADPH dehydrogenase NamA [Clostridium sp. Cult2]